jgi:glycosyltransferase involved in cell wall biosynthesis
MKNITVIFPTLKLKTFWVKALLKSLKRYDLFLIAAKSDEKFIREYNTLLLYSPFLFFFKKLKDIFRLEFLDFFILKKIQSRNTEILMINFLNLATKYIYLIDNFRGKTIIHVHGKDIIWDFVDEISGKRIYDSKYFRKVKELGSKCYFIANSSYSKNQLIAIGIDPSRIFVKYFGMELHRESERIFPSNVMNFLFLGRLIDCKNPLLVLKAFNVAKESGLKAKLTIAGDGPLYNECRKVIEKSKWRKDIRLLGWVNHTEAFKLFKNNDVFLMPGRKGIVSNQEEAFGLVYLEAMSFGLPVIGGNSGGVPEIISHGYNGYMVEDRIESLVSLMIAIAESPDLYSRLSRNAIETIRNKYNIKNERTRMNEILESIIECR